MRPQDTMSPNAGLHISAQRIKEFTIVRPLERGRNKISHEGIVYGLSASAENANAR